MLHPIRELFRGSRAFVEGLRWLRAHPRYLFVLFLPSLLGLGLMLLSGALFLEHRTTLIKALLFEPGTGLGWTILYYVCKGLLYATGLLFSLILGLLSANIVAAPIYEWVSAAIERDIKGVAPSLSFGRSLLLIPEELKKVLFILLASVAVFLIPGLNSLGILFTAFLLGWDVYDYPMVRRGWSLRLRLAFIFKDFWPILGLGLWQIIPLANFVLMPLAIAGGTLLSLQRIEKQPSSVAV